MSLRGLRLATQFLTRLPVPGVVDFSPADLSRAGPWFPFVGAIIGALVATVMIVTRLLLADGGNALLTGVLGVVAWAWITGALHLDGLGDLADALAASHRDPQRFLSVLSDPHLGTFGVVSIVFAILMKTAALSAAPGYSIAALALVAAWARLGPLGWSRWLKPLKPGSGERFAWSPGLGWIACWTVVLLAASAVAAPILCIAPLVLLAWGIWLKVRLGGMTGDCLGAGVEVTEVALLLILALAARLFRDEHGWLNQAVAAVCEQVFLVTAGLPLRLKPGG